MKDEFLATLSHELRTPLNAILGWTQLMLSEDLDEDETRVAIETVDRNARTQAQLIEDLLDISRITSGKLRLDMQDVEINDVIAAAVDSIRPTAESKGVSVTLSQCDRCAVHADPARLQQIVWNLLSNAVKFTPSGGTVNVTASTEDAQVFVKVADKGAGIDPAFLPYVFDRFRQADGSTTRRQGGLGLGLSIVKQLVELHGGSVTVESKGLGEGATFTVTFPVLADQSDASFHKSPLEGHHGLVDLTGVHILVVDDEPDSREVLRRALVERKANVRVAASVNEALAAIDGAKPDLILSDISMPERDGYDLIHELRTDGHAAERIPAIAITAFARPDDRDKILRAGFQGHLAKPIDLSSLSRIMKDVLAGPAPPDRS